MCLSLFDVILSGCTPCRCLPADFPSVSSARLSSARTSEGRNVMWRGGRDHTRGDPGGRGATEGRGRLICHPAVRRFLALSFNSASKQTPNEPKVTLITMHSALRCTQTCMSSQSDARQASMPQPHVWASRQKLVSKHVCVWTCHLLLLLNKSFASHCSNLYGNQCWQAVRAWFIASSLRIGQQWITVRLAADHRRFTLTQD